MYPRTSDIDIVAEGLRLAFPKLSTNELDFLKSSIERSLENIDYSTDFPEDMVEGRTDWEELKGMFDDLKGTLLSVLDAVTETVHKGEEKA